MCRTTTKDFGHEGEQRNRCGWHHGNHREETRSMLLTLLNRLNVLPHENNVSDIKLRIVMTEKYVIFSTISSEECTSLFIGFT